MTPDTGTLRHFIGGQWLNAPAASHSDNPSDLDDIVAEVPLGGAAEIDAAVAAARAAFPAWSQATPEARADMLDRAGELILQRRESLGRLLSREEGKTLPEGIGETVRAGRIFKYFAGEALRRHGQALDSVRPGVSVLTRREALGVVGLITPWNFPIAIPTWKAAPALAFGNTVVLKPAPQTPAMAAALAAILLEAGLPAGVLNLVFGGAEAGTALSAHPDVAALSFTGSQAVGARVAAAAMARQARVQLEMGGKNPLVVLDDAELDRAVQCALDGGYFATGQRCTASSRIIVTAGVHDAFVERLTTRLRALRVGHALQADTQMGPAVSQAQLDRSLAYVALAREQGGELLCGGEPLQLSTRGHYISPALITGTDGTMRINQEEVFGPVASVIRVADYDAALAAANEGRFGLSAGIVTSSLRHAQHFQRQVQAGMVMVNLPTAGVDYHVPFGGTRQSSYGPREQGFAAIEFYTQTKTVYMTE